MKLAFDLISDLHVETWNSPLDWTGMATSMICVVAGDISRDRTKVVETLTHLGQCYKSVIYIDGNDEHRYSFDSLGESYRTLVSEIENIPNVVYLQDNVVIIDGVAFLGTNGWWSFDLDNTVDYDATRQWFTDQYRVSRLAADNIESMAIQDVGYLIHSIKRLQTYQDVKQIVMVTHTVPNFKLVSHDINLSKALAVNCLGNSHMNKTFISDWENKISTWCFGHYHSECDQTIDGVRYVNNCRGRGNTAWAKTVYYPKRIEINY